ALRDSDRGWAVRQQQPAEQCDGAVPVSYPAHPADGCGCGQCDHSSPTSDQVTASALQPKESVALPPLIGVSEAIATAKSRLERFARTELPILLMGPTGTGKEVVARHVHAMSGRRGRLVDVNCGALPRDMIESLLFGHRRGAFTGAVERSTGLIVSAHEGTLFLDELTSLPPEGQAKLLRVL